VTCPNVPGVIAALVSNRICTLHELQTAYGAEDAYNLYEIITVDAINEIKAREKKG